MRKDDGWLQDKPRRILTSLKLFHEDIFRLLQIVCQETPSAWLLYLTIIADLPVKVKSHQKVSALTQTSQK